MSNLSDFNNLINIRNHLRIMGESTYYDTPHRATLFQAQKKIDDFIVNHISDIESSLEDLANPKPIVVQKTLPNSTLTVEVDDSSFEEAWQEVVEKGGWEKAVEANTNIKSDKKIRNGFVKFGDDQKVPFVEEFVDEPTEQVNMQLEIKFVEDCPSSIEVPEPELEGPVMPTVNESFDLSTITTTTVDIEESPETIELPPTEVVSQVEVEKPKSKKGRKKASKN